MAKEKANAVIETKVNGKSMEEFMADTLAEIDKKTVNLEKVKAKNDVMKQYNNYSKNVIEVYRLELKEKTLDFQERFHSK